MTTYGVAPRPEERTEGLRAADLLGKIVALSSPGARLDVKVINHRDFGPRETLNCKVELFDPKTKSFQPAGNTLIFWTHVQSQVAQAWEQRQAAVGRLMKISSDAQAYPHYELVEDEDVLAAVAAQTAPKEAVA